MKSSKLLILALLLIILPIVNATSFGYNYLDIQPSGNITYQNNTFINQTIELNDTQFDILTTPVSIDLTWLTSFIESISKWLNYYNKSEVYNKTEIDSKIPVYQCTIRETADLMNLATPFDNWNSVAVSTGTFADAYAQPWYITNNATFKDRNGVFAFRAHATNAYSGAYIRTGRKEILDDNSTYIVRANVLFANITGNSTMNGSNYLYTGQNVAGCIGQDRSNFCGSDTNKAGAWGLHFDGTNLRYYICTRDTACYNQVLSTLTSLNLPVNTWLVIEAKLNTSYGFYGNIWNQETGELLYTKSKAWGTTETPANLAAFPVGDFNKVEFQTIAINPFTTASSPVFIDWTDLCIIGHEVENWGKIE